MRQREVVAHPFENVDRLESVELGQHHHELLAAPARDQVVVAEGLLGGLGEQAQRTVAGLVAVGVVELLEPVEVRDDDREQAPGLHQLAKLLLGGAPVDQSREAVRRGLELGLFERTDRPDPRARLTGEHRELVHGLARRAAPRPGPSCAERRGRGP